MNRELGRTIRARRTLLGAVFIGCLGAWIAAMLVLPAPVAGATPAMAFAGPDLSDTAGAGGPATTAAPSLALSVSAQPNAICVDQTTTCQAGVGVARVTLSATAPQSSFETWPAVQVAFVIETTLYDGVYDPTAGTYGFDQCANAHGGAGGACEESNGVPFFAANAQNIANAIQAANPHTTVSFAMVHYFASLDFQDDGDGPEYQVDIPHFVPASQFGADVQTSFVANYLESGYRHEDSDFSDNILHSSSITALYGTIIGSGLDWSNDTHHVIVWMGSTAPRDPNYEQNYCVSPSAHYPPGDTSLPCYSTGCEPAYDFGSVSSPDCEGWINSQNGNKSDSIAQLASTSPTCTDSVGGVCTVDAIDLWDTATDPYSPGWPLADANIGGAPGGTMVLQNTVRVLLAGCDLAAATHGTWDGPSYFECPDGQSGTLQPEFLGPFGNPNMQNPSLFAALRGIGFGPVTSDLVATGTNHPLFTFVPTQNFAVLPGGLAEFKTECLLGTGGLSRDCPVQPTEKVIPTGPGANTTVYGWNWSSIPADNQMFAGDTWYAAFNVYATGPPYGQDAVDACKTPACALADSSPIDGYYTSATYLPATSISVVTQSFPLGTLEVQSPPSALPPPTLPPTAPPLPPPPFPVLAGVPVLTGIGVGAQVGIASLSLQAAAAGFVAAGFTSISVRNRPLSIAQAQLRTKSPPVRSRFEENTGSGASIGKME
jgi:hypothetical protein